MVISTFLCSQVPSARFNGDHALDTAIADAVDLIDQIRQDAGVIRDDGDLVADLKGQRFVALDEAVLTKSSDFLVYLYAGGSGSLTGSVIGAVLLTILPEVLRFLADWRLVLYALILVVVMLYRSEGLCGGKEVPFLRIKRSSLYEQPLFGRKKNDTSKK